MIETIEAILGIVLSWFVMIGIIGLLILLCVLGIFAALVYDAWKDSVGDPIVKVVLTLSIIIVILILIATR